MASYML